MYKRNYTPDEKANMWMDHRAIQNMMGRYVRELMLKQEEDIFDKYWSRFESDVCYGVNEGWFAGRDEVEAYYKKLADNTKKRSLLIQKLFPEFLGDKSEKEIRGVGQMRADGLSAPVLEVSGLGTTAKGLWLFVCADHRIGPEGPYTYSESGYYAVDFTKENTEWKIWHMQRIVECGGPQGKDFIAKKEQWEIPAAKKDFEELSALKEPEPNLKKPIREAYYLGRPEPEKVPYPVPFYDFQDTFSYGCDMGADRYASNEW